MIGISLASDFASDKFFIDYFGNHIFNAVRLRFSNLDLQMDRINDTRNSICDLIWTSLTKNILKYESRTSSE